MPITGGDRVTVRGEAWIVEETTAFGETTLLNLRSTNARAAERRCRLLLPFDTPVPARRQSRICALTRRRWMHHLHSQISELHAFGELRAPQRAAIDILAFQLEPALALVRGHASRFLLADEVGLGKTIQAGLMLSELLLRGWCERALIVSPAGLREQWAGELLRRFEIHATVIDSPSLAVRAGSLPHAVNPWAVETVTIASIDYVKQPEVLRGLASQSWDVLIVDEVHQATVASQRYDAVSELAKRARHVLLLTATPHAGDDRAYRALCAIGAIVPDDPLLRFRRTREAIGAPRSRRVHLLPVTATPAGMEMHRLLDDYLAQLWNIARRKGRRDVQLAAMVLAKRAFSTARSLAISLERRLEALIDGGEAGEQPVLPLALEDDASDEAPAPVARAFDHPDTERAIVQRIIAAAAQTQREERKIQVLKRILRRVREPLIIFTEYRDTLDAIESEIRHLRHITTLHGGQTAQERQESIRAFTGGTADVMVATDAGSVGLNLHANCRLVVNLELPWNPMRLEQRIGRVDRIGQARTVHAINLLAEGTAERSVLASLLRRLERIQMSDIEIASYVITQSQPVTQTMPAESCTKSVDVAASARCEADRLNQRRRRGRGGPDLADGMVPVTVIRSPAASLTTFFRIRLISSAGRLIEDALVPVRVSTGITAAALRRRDARALGESLIARFGAQAARCAQLHAESRARTAALESAPAILRALIRERAIAEYLAPHALPLVQAGLFDNRALKAMAAEQERRERTRQDSDIRTRLLDADSDVRLAHDPELAMVLVLCSPA